MNESRYTTRDYRKSDYATCERLVSNAWAFNKNFKPQGLADIAKRLYTMGALRGSNYFRVVETHGEVVGFIFGLNEKSKKPGKLPAILFGLGILRRLLFLLGTSYKIKKALLNALYTHSANRLEVVKPGRSEITLFIIDPDHQGVGNGKRLLAEFIEHCKVSGVTSVIVETNTKGAASFYEGVGFKLVDYFDSPLHRYAEKEGKACMYELLCK